MAISPSLAANLASGGSNLLDVGVNAVLQGAQNAKNRKWSEKMYNRQRSDAISDWNMQNAYNAPSAQMERLKAAKLNPNLIYGTGVQASGLSGSVRSSSPPSYKGEAPQINTGGAVAAFIDTKMKQQQIDVMKSVIDTNQARQAQIMNDAILKAKSANLIDTRDARAKFDLNFQKGVVGLNVDTMSAKLDLIKAQKDKVVTDTFMTMHEDLRRAMLSKATFQEKIQHVALMVAQEYATKEGAGLTSDKRAEIAQHISNMIKSGELTELQKEYQDQKNNMQWMETLKGLMPSFLLPIMGKGGAAGLPYNTPKVSPWRGMPAPGGNRFNY